MYTYLLVVKRKLKLKHPNRISRKSYCSPLLENVSKVLSDLKFQGIAYPVLPNEPSLAPAACAHILYSALATDRAHNRAPCSKHCNVSGLCRVLITVQFSPTARRLQIA